MTLDAKALGVAAAIVAAATYVICGLSVALSPAFTQAAFSYVLHADLTGLSRPISLASFVFGLLVFSALIGLCVYFTARLYNALLSRQSMMSEVRRTAAATR